MTESEDGDERPRSLLADCIEDPGRAKRRLPAILGLLEAEDAQTRLAAAWTCCLVTTTHPNTVEYVVERLGDRLGEGEVTLELTHALDYLADRHPTVVETVFAEADRKTEDSDGPAGSPLPRTGSITRNHFYGRGPDRPGVGRVRLPSAPDDDPRSTYTTGQPDEREIAENRAELADGDGDSADADPDSANTDGDAAGAETDRGDGEAAGDDESQAPGTFVRPTTDVSEIAVRSRFDKLHILASQAHGRYSEDYRALVGRGGEERAIALRLLDLPDGTEARDEFESDAADVLERWAAVAAHPHVVTLLDWGVEPRPWLATTFTGASLARQERVADERALSDAVAMADALAHLHRNDVVHAGIDPGNAAYASESLDGTDRAPLLNNVGLLGFLRQYENPAAILDPRYAAPEYFDSRFGVVDAATDVYQLGAVVYHLYAGRPPFDGSFGEVRDAVTSPATPVPGDVVDGVPARIDEVVSKAMAAQKLTRYEAVDHLQQDLRSIRSERE